MAKNELILKGNEVITNSLEIQSMIYTIRGVQVMLDSDLAILYGVTTGNLNKAMKRNIERFPANYCFQLNKQEYSDLIFQNGISSSNNNYGGRRSNPYVYTEHGVSMLSSVLRSETAIKISIEIIDIFIEMRKFISDNANLLSKINKLEEKQITFQIESNNKFADNDVKFDKLFQYISDHQEVKEKIFYKGQIYDAYSLLIDLISKANKSMILIDNYIDKITLDILSHKKR